MTTLGFQSFRRDSLFVMGPIMLTGTDQCLMSLNLLYNVYIYKAVNMESFCRCVIMKLNRLFCDKNQNGLQI